MRPESVPTLKGKAAREFEKRISGASASKNKAILSEAEKVYKAIKKSS